MCLDLAEYNPFEIYEMDYDSYDEWIIYSEPMEEYNWQEFLQADDYLLDLNS